MSVLEGLGVSSGITSGCDDNTQLLLLSGPGTCKYDLSKPLLEDFLTFLVQIPAFGDAVSFSCLLGFQGILAVSSNVTETIHVELKSNIKSHIQQ